MELYVQPEIAKDIIEIASKFDVDAQIIGRVEASPTKKLTIKSNFGTFEY
jgi:phosphoribosylformylglycinamidine cyclo-ligase